MPKTHISYTDEVESGKSYYYAILTFVDKQGAEDKYAGLYYDEELDGPDGDSRVDRQGSEDSGMLYAAVLPGLNSTVAPDSLQFPPSYAPKEQTRHMWRTRRIRRTRCVR